MSDNNSGCLPGVILLVLAILIGSVLVGGPVLSSAGLSWDNSAAINREAQRTERTRIEANRDIRIEAQRSATMQAFLEVAGKAVIVVAIVVGALKTLPPIVQALATAFAAWAARPHRPVVVPPQIIMVAQPILDAEPSAYMEWVKERDFQGWAIINPRTKTVLQIEDKQARH